MQPLVTAGLGDSSCRNGGAVLDRPGGCRAAATGTI